MSRPHARGSHRSDTILLSVLGAAIGLTILLLVIWATRGKDKGPHFLKKLSLEWTISPVWTAPLPQAVQTADVTGASRSLEVYLDISVPVGGFLPPAVIDREPSGFRSMVNLVPDLLVDVSGRTESPVHWYGVSSGVAPFARRPELMRRGLFSGKETRLDLALRQILERLDRGDAAMVALVTDLIATEDLVGAMGVGKSLSDWMRSGKVRSGALGVGLLGIRASYWGIQGKCRGDGDLGCWFSEQAQEYRPLTRIAKKPFYILVLGRDLASVERLGQALLDRAGRLKLEAHWELLSAASHSRMERSECQAHKVGEPNRDQFALVLDEDGSYECRRSEKIVLDCSVPADVEQGSINARASWKEVQAEVREGRMVITVDCERLLSHPPTSDLFIELASVPVGGWSEVWKKWSAETDEREEDVGRTLRLEEFIGKVWLRPDRVRLTSRPLLKGRAE